MQLASHAHDDLQRIHPRDPSGLRPQARDADLRFILNLLSQLNLGTCLSLGVTNSLSLMRISRGLNIITLFIVSPSTSS